ncbi:hypothetical protein [Paraliomyxa miuraensis]|uniref:hypothetical protein n=1 Tax=Paraliomyxa miuraensis TaxID=376150 RepID=UPI00225BF890|nr:hypothetical protein [Paraliomyxa miuraensis]MCX4243927.1 hypothetical protein [Paraliomyxa miuraensis]
MHRSIALAVLASTVLATHARPALAAEPAPVHVTAPRLDRPPHPPPSRRMAKAKPLSRKDRRTARAFVAAGSAVFGVFYLTATFVGANSLDEIHEDGQVTPEERDEERISKLVFLPVAGPLVAAPFGRTKGDKAGLVGFGLIQAAGLAYLAGGSVMLARDRRARRLELMAGPTPSGGTLGLRGRF